LDDARLSAHTESLQALPLRVNAATVFIPLACCRVGLGAPMRDSTDLTVPHTTHGDLPAAGPGAFARVVLTAWRLQLKTLSASAFFLVLAVVQPIVVATIALYAAGGARTGRLHDLVLGAAATGMWSTTLASCGGVINYLRRLRVLEFCVAASVPFAAVVSGMTLAGACLGVYSLAATLTWSWIAFGVQPGIAHPLSFGIAGIVLLLALTSLGQLMAATFIFFRTAIVFQNLLELPVWLLSGMLAPIALLPSYIRPLSYALAPTWGLEAMRAAAHGSGRHALTPTAVCAGLGVAYAVLTALVLPRFERRARVSGTLALS
jgi:ABC-2 type transport system permease protein